MQPVISIIMSTYREIESGELERAIKSVANQTFKEWELIIVGDCAPNPEKIKTFCHDPRITFINPKKRTGTNSPGTVPKIIGIKSARGKYLCFLDADNEFTKMHLENCVNALRSNSDLDLVYGNTLIKFSYPRVKVFDSLVFVWEKPKWNAKRQKKLQSSNFLDMSEPVFTRKAYDSSGGLNKSVRASDWDLWRRMTLAKHNKFMRLEHTGLIYYTSSLMQYFEYYILMLLQRYNLQYNAGALDGIIKRRHKNKHK
jgi:glycosyltransferase involved in cell wall biosynthesis